MVDESVDNLPNASSVVTYIFSVEIVSGWLKNKKYEGCFSYNSSHLTQHDVQELEVLDVRFRYQGVDYTLSSFDDGFPRILFKGGEFQDLLFVGGSQKRRFGLNAGFDRLQFGSPEEAFVKEGASYFGYLDPDNYVEGAGRVTYVKQLDPFLTCNSTQLRLVPVPIADEGTLVSEKGVNYTQLRDFLKGGQWKAADSETSAIILQVAGQVERGWLDDDDIENFSSVDLSIIDKLWLQYSKGRYGLSVQKRIWQNVEEDYLKFSDDVGWRLGKSWLSYHELEFSTQAPLGHLPFTRVSEKPGVNLPNPYQNWISTNLPLWISRSDPMMGKKTSERSGEKILEGILLRTLLERLELNDS